LGYYYGAKEVRAMQDEEEEVEEEQAIRVPAEATPPEEVEEKPKDELEDLFEVPQEEDNDMATDHLVDVDEEEDLSDLTDVSREDVMGTPPVVRKRKVRPKPRHSQPPPTSLGGVGY